MIASIRTVPEMCAILATGGYTTGGAQRSAGSFIPLKILTSLGFAADARGAGGGASLSEPPNTSPTPPGTPPVMSEIAGAAAPASAVDMATFFGMTVDAVWHEAAKPSECFARVSLEARQAKA